MKKNISKHGVKCALILIVFLIPFVLSCRDDDETEIRICNLDNHEYDVELRRESDDRVEDELHIEEWYELGDQCDTFKNVDEGRYYLALIDDDGDVVDESDDFYMDEGESKVFNINGDGDIINGYHAEAVVSVCNLDDDEYRVELKRSSDDSLVADFDLEKWFEFLDQCDDFDELDEGQYYIEIYKDGDTNRADRSDDFYLDPRGNDFFTINPNGDLVGD